ncbi:MAG: phospholipase D family protein, partial [Desulfurococcaceae archaeon]
MSSSVCYSLSDVPGKLRGHIESATQSLWVSTAFLDNCGLELLKTVSGKGVELRVLVSTAVSSELVKEISKFANVRVLEEKFMHAKIYIADGKALIGSPNLTCPVLEGKNIEVLCEVAAEEAIRIYNSLWESAKPLKPEVPGTLLLRIKDTPNRIIIESSLGPGLRVEVDKMLKRIVREVEGKILVCPQIAEYTCADFENLNEYEQMVSIIFKTVNGKQVNLCNWSYTITHFHMTYGFGHEREIDPAYFLVSGLQPVVSYLYSDALKDSVYAAFSEVLRSLNIDYVNRCVKRTSSSPRACIRILEKPAIQIIYDIVLEVDSPECEKPSQDETEKIKAALERVKPLFEEEVKKLYSNYLTKKKEYGESLIEIEGVLVTYLRVLVGWVYKN